MTDWLKGWLASEETSHDKIEVKRIYIDLNEGNLYDGVIFSQIMYWHGTSRETGKPRMTIEKEGHLWLAKGYGDWFIECRIGEATARQCISRIEKRGLIVKKLWKFNNTPTVHIRIDWDSLEEQLKWICYGTSNGFDTTYQIGSDTSYQMNSTSDNKSLTETTSSTTTETKSRKPRTPSKKKESAWIKENELIQVWAKLRNLRSAAIGAPIETPTRQKCARRMLKWPRPITTDEIADAIKTSNSTNYEFTWLESDVPKRRGLRANVQQVVPEATLEIVPKVEGEELDLISEDKRLLGLQMIADLAAAKGRKKEAV